MVRKLLIALGLMASPVFAEPFVHSGYTLGCSDAGCTVFAAGFLLHVANDGSTPARIIAQLANLATLTAVNLKGDLGELGDASAPLTLTGLSVKNGDIYQDTLRAVQGTWLPKGKDPATFLVIHGLEWQAMAGAEGGTTFLISPGATCADGTAPGGMVLSLYGMGGDPSEAACLQVEAVSATELDLRDAKGGAGKTVYIRK